MADARQQARKKVLGERGHDGHLNLAGLRVGPAIQLPVLYHDAIGVLPSGGRSDDGGRFRIPGFAAIAGVAQQDLGGGKESLGEVVGPLDGFLPVFGRSSQNGGGGSFQNAGAAVQFRIDQVDRDLAGKPVDADQGQRQDQGDGHHGDKRIGHDEAVAQTPDQLPDAGSGQPDGHQKAHDPGGEGDQQSDEGGWERVGQHQGQKHQDEERLFDAPELAVERFQAWGHSNSS